MTSKYQKILPIVFKMAHIDIIIVTCTNNKWMQFSYIRFKLAANIPILHPFSLKSLADSLFLSYIPLSLDI